MLVTVCNRGHRGRGGCEDNQRHEPELRQLLSHHPTAGVRPQHGRHLAPAGGAGGPSHAAAGRQRGRCRRGGGGGYDDLRTGQQWPGQRRLLHPVGRPATAWPERRRPCARQVERGLLSQEIRCRRCAAQARHRQRDGARRRQRVGATEQALWPSAAGRRAGAGHRHRRTRLRRAGGGAAEMGRCRARVGIAARLLASVHALGPRAAGR